MRGPRSSVNRFATASGPPLVPADWHSHQGVATSPFTFAGDFSTLASDEHRCANCTTACEDEESR